ncbi:cupin domain-containing protein [Actinotalea ferrariae]|uniref:cupin domain-containing protein n=1 Tax=Actinotalea ferrariae TaxID=1386098 RepID=UPI001C8BA3E4|nr:cupin domain-containing protein [Actinotalea ferrariae]MBX9245590.1 cupin domain-containing protein [Actinotalea ferrariae]
MLSRVTAAELRIGTGRTSRFEGEEYGSEVSFFLVDSDPGQGPSLHRHPYTETWVVLEGEATVTADGEEHHAAAGDILVVGAGTHHKFVATGTGPLRMACIHGSPRMIQENLE